MNIQLLLLSIILILSTSTIACTETVEQGDASIPEPTSLVDVLEAKEMGTFAALLVKANLLDELSSKSDEITILAPADSVFSAIDPADLEKMTSDSQALKNLLKRHILDQKLALDELAEMTEVKTLSQETITLSQNENKQLQIVDQVVTEGNFSCEQGLIHRLNAIIVLEPSETPNP
jgi:uncharacterized surface protein with fasciclin (FAS1) repeats